MTTPSGRGRRAARRSDITRRTNILRAEGIPQDVIDSRRLAQNRITTKGAKRFRDQFARDLANAERLGIDRERAIQQAANITNRAQRIIVDRRFRLLRQGFREDEIDRGKLDQISFRNRGIKEIRAMREDRIRSVMRERGLTFRAARGELARRTVAEQRRRGIPLRAILDTIYPVGSSRFE